VEETAAVEFPVWEGAWISTRVVAVNAVIAQHRRAVRKR